MLALIRNVYQGRGNEWLQVCHYLPSQNQMTCRFSPNVGFLQF